MLELAGFQTRYKDDKGRLHWALTDLGRNHATYLAIGKKQVSGQPVRQIRWYGKTVNQLNITAQHR